MSASNLLCRVPLVSILINYPSSPYNGKYTLNTSSAYVEYIGGPWSSEEELVKAVLDTGAWELVEGMSSPHFVRKSHA